MKKRWNLVVNHALFMTIILSGCVGPRSGGQEMTEKKDIGTYNIGICPDHRGIGIKLAKRHAISVQKTIDLGDVGSVVTGRFDSSAREILRNHRHIKYVEEDRTAKAQKSTGKSTSAETQGDDRECNG